jgi:lysozyme family protein
VSMIIKGTSKEAVGVLSSLQALSPMLFQVVETVEEPKPEPVKPTPVEPVKPEPKPDPKPVAETDFYKKLTHLVDVKKDWLMSNDDSKKLWDALVAQANDKAAFNKRVSLGVQPSYGAAQCATTTASVIEGAAIAAGLTQVASMFDKDEREKNQRFALTHQIEIALRRLGFTMWDKKLFIAPRGAICMMVGRYNFAGVKQHSGHVYTMNTDKGPDAKDIINDNGGFEHLYGEFTESFFLPAGIVPEARTVTDKPVGLTVSEIQSELNEHFDAGLEVDGQIGPMTMAAIKRAETFLKLTVDGKADPSFIEALLALKGLVFDITPAKPDDHEIIKSSNFELSRETYQHLWETCEIRPECLSVVKAVCAKLQSYKARYVEVMDVTGVPWEIIACIHNLECSCRFDRHLHEGSPLTGRTLNVPKGRPIKGNPPFSWFDSAVDALGYDKLTEVKDWSPARAMHMLCAYNGFGYISKGINSPYLFSMTNQYVKGKYTSDGVYNPEAVSQQVGAVAILKMLGYC